MRDEVYRDNQQIVDFAFSAEVAAVFPDMIRRSVPGYETVIPMTGLMAARHLGAAGTAFDLGCSLGATTLAILTQTDAAEVRVVGVDSSAPMVAGARANITDPRASFIEADFRDVDLSGASVVILNLVLQFIEPDTRLAALDKIRREMDPAGLLLVTEKVLHDDTDLHAFYDQTHLAWKRANGYSELEVSQKRSALENVMRIDTEAAHLERFRAAGFSAAEQWYRCLNWASFMVLP